MTSKVIATYQAGPLPSLDSDLWSKCEPVRITHYWSGEPAPPSRHAEARICWNDEGLLVRFVCEQHEPLIVSDNPVTDKKTKGLWDRDVCEIFLAPDSTRSDVYFEFEAAPTGEWIDLGICITPQGRETEWDYASGMTTASRVETESLTLSIFVPWSERLLRPSIGDEWRVNLFRCVGPEESTRYLAWRPTKTSEPNFHVPAAFGVLQFS